MNHYICLLLLVLSSPLVSLFSIQQKTTESDIDVIDIGDDKDITEINKDLGDDIIVPKGIQRSAVNRQQDLWSLPVPYVLDESLTLNAKGVILRSLDQFRLKSCIDFKIRGSEEYYISVEKRGGCYSYVGRYFPNGQTLSIGTYCDTNAVVEHEFLHALGFNHEQSRYDRDEHVTIKFENIQRGFENNFQKVSEEDSTTNGVPYDYMSVMHYSSYAFSNGNGSTIMTKDPAFQDIIGQRLEMSPSDVKELNLLYKCNSSISFLMHCSFSKMSTCGVSRCSQGSRGFENVLKVPGGPSTDRTNLKSYNKIEAPAPSSFMHASTAFGQVGESSRLETKRMSPSRSCPVQCLQFYYFHTGNETDQLNIWIREFRDEKDVTGHSRMVGQIIGQRTTQWKYHHVSLGATRDFQVVFEVRKGAGSSSGGFSIDDINVSELECPHVAIQIDDFETVMETADYGTRIYSPVQYTDDGYAFRVAAILYRSYFGLLIQLVEGKNDDNLQWPLLNRQVTFQAVDQNPNIQLQMSKQRSMTSDASHILYNDTTVWDSPRKTGRKVVVENGQEIYVGPLIGRTYFASLDEIKQRDFLKGESAVFTFSFQDITPLINGSALPCALPTKGILLSKDNFIEPCSRSQTTTSAPPSPTSPAKTTPEATGGTTSPSGTTVPPEMTTERVTTTSSPSTTTPEATAASPEMTTDDGSIFGFAPGLVSSALLTIFSALLLLLH